MMRDHQRRGAILVYAFFLMMAMAGMTALAVDWGRLQVTKSELRSAADAAARYAAAGLQNDVDGISAAFANATASVAQNQANGRPITFVPSQDVEVGVWNVTTRTFTPNTNLNVTNAVRVTLRCTAARGSAVPLTFLPAVGGQAAQDISAVSVAMIDFTGNIGAAGNGRYEYFVPATSNLWLAGMPAGSVASSQNAHSNPDYAGTAMTDAGQAKNYDIGRGYTNGGSTTAGSANQNYAAWGDYASKKASPIQAGGLAVSGGSTITMDGVNGGANNQASSSTFSAEGNAADPTWDVPYELYRSYIFGGYASFFSENGIANVYAPHNAVMGVFLSDSQPSSTVAPAPLDFGTAASRDFTTLKPALKQPFFIGDGRTSTGEVQQFVPPAGATRLFLGTMDGYEWSNNVGGFYVTAHAKGRIITVK